MPNYSISRPCLTLVILALIGTGLVAYLDYAKFEATFNKID